MTFKPPHAAAGLPSGRLSEVVLAQMSESVGVLDRNWRILYLNRRARDEIGDAVGQTLWQALPQLDETPFGPLYRQCMADGVTRSHEGYFAPLGNWYAVKIVSVAEGLAIFFRVTSEQKQTELALKSSRARLQTIFQTLEQGVLVLDGQGTILDANPAAARILGVALERIRGALSRADHWQFFDHAGRAVAGKGLRSLLALSSAPPIRSAVVGFRRAKGQDLRWLSIDVSPLPDPHDGLVDLVYMIFSDITQRRDAEQALLRSKLFLSSAQRVASIGSAAIDFRTGKWDWSDETYRIYGVDPKSFTPSAESLAALVHPDDHDALMSKPAVARRGIVPPPIEYRIRRPDGQERILRRVATLVREPDGKISGIVGTVQDVTDLRRAQIEQETLRTQLNHAQRLDVLGTLAGGIAHDLNNTLVPVLALSEAVARSLPEDDPRRPMVDLVVRAGERGRDLVARILAFARRSDPDKGLIELPDVVASALRLMRASIPAHIEIIERLSSVPQILGDAAQLHQVLVNLFTNAAQAIGDKIGLIEVAVSEAPADSLDTTGQDRTSYVVITVSDSGCGMDESVQARMFEPFFTTKGLAAGTGLGLSVVQGIVTAHGGQIRLASRPGAGSRFEIYLPINTASTLPAAAQRAR